MKNSHFLRYMLLLGLCFLGFVVTSKSQLPINISYNWRPPFPVIETIDNSIPFWGFASYLRNAQPFIRYNLASINQMRVPQEELVFLRVHEHGHIVLRTSNETRADCWASQQLAGTDPGILDKAISFTDMVLGNSVVEGLSGHQRAAIMRQCKTGVDRGGEGGITEGGGITHHGGSSREWATALKFYIASSHHNFTKNTGSKIDSTTRKARVWLPHALACEIIDIPYANCLMGNFNTLREADDFYDAIVKSVKDNLPSGWEVNGEDSTSSTVLREDSAKKEGDPEIKIRLRESSRGPHSYAVWISVWPD